MLWLDNFLFFRSKKRWMISLRLEIVIFSFLGFYNL